MALKPLGMLAGNPKMSTQHSTCMETPNKTNVTNCSLALYCFYATSHIGEIAALTRTLHVMLCASVTAVRSVRFSQVRSKRYAVDQPSGACVDGSDPFIWTQMKFVVFVSVPIGAMQHGTTSVVEHFQS